MQEQWFPPSIGLAPPPRHGPQGVHSTLAPALSLLRGSRCPSGPASTPRELGRGRILHQDDALSVFGAHTGDDTILMARTAMGRETNRAQARAHPRGAVAVLYRGARSLRVESSGAGCVAVAKRRTEWNSLQCALDKCRFALGIELRMRDTLLAGGRHPGGTSNTSASVAERSAAAPSLRTDSPHAVTVRETLIVSVL